MSAWSQKELLKNYGQNVIGYKHFVTQPSKLC